MSAADNQESRTVTDPDRLVAIGLAAGRIGIGAGLWLAPKLSAKALGFGEPNGPTLAVGRIAATRDLVLGALQLTALDDRERLARISAAVAVCDAGDALTFALALRDPETRTAGLRGIGAAAAATAAGVWLAGRLRGLAAIAEA
jgi:hypothetical protein